MALPWNMITTGVACLALLVAPVACDSDSSDGDGTGSSGSGGSDDTGGAPSFTFPDPDNPTHADLQQVWDATCGATGELGGCHDSNTPLMDSLQQHDLSLLSGNAYNALTTGMSMQATDGMPFVTPGDTANSYLWYKLNGTQGQVASGNSAGFQMPQFQDPLDAETLSVIENWINNGAPE